MRKILSIILSTTLIFSLSGCSGGRSAMAENENLGKILSQTAVVSTEEVGEPTPAVDKLSDKNAENEGATYYKLKANMNIYVDAGDYVVSMAKADCSITAYDSSGNAISTVNISKERSDSVIPHVANLSVPEGGYLSANSDCVAMKK